MDIEEQRKLGKEAAMKRHPEKFPEFTKQQRKKDVEALPPELKATLTRRGFIKEEQ